MSGDYYLDIKNTKVDFYILKGIVEDLLDYLGYNGRYTFDISGDIPNELHPGQSANIIVQGKKMGMLGKLHPNVTKKDIFVFEINLDELLGLYPSKMSYKDIPKYPSIVKDMAFIINKNMDSIEVEKVIKKAGGRLLNNIEVFDLYVGENIGVLEKSIAYKLTFQDLDKTLTDDEIMPLFNKIIEDVESKCNAKLRN